MRTSVQCFARTLVAAAATTLAFAGASTTAAAQDRVVPLHGGAAHDARCPMQLQHRSAEQVLEAHLAAVRSGNAALVACDYARDAVFLLPGSVAQGPEQIEAVFAGLFESAGAILSVTATSMTTQGGAILLTYTVDSEHIVVPNGVDTFVIEKGRIVLQTAYLGGLTTR